MPGYAKSSTHAIEMYGNRCVNSRNRPPYGNTHVHGIEKVYCYLEKIREKSLNRQYKVV